MNKCNSYLGTCCFCDIQAPQAGKKGSILNSSSVHRRVTAHPWKILTYPGPYSVWNGLRAAGLCGRVVQRLRLQILILAIQVRLLARLLYGCLEANDVFGRCSSLLSPKSWTWSFKCLRWFPCRESILPELKHQNIIKIYPIGIKYSWK